MDAILMYALLREVLFCLEPERAHHIALSILRFMPKVLFVKPPCTVVRALGLDFPHPVGLAAGFDKNGNYLDALAKLGFSFIELGTVTPRPQSGNPRPRLFRIPQAQAIINRMGFNNQGVDVLLDNISRAQYQGILGINIGKNKDTPVNQSVDDYLYCFRQVYSRASYVTVNISSPNTPDLRQLQHGAYFKHLIGALGEARLALSDRHQRYVPLVVKLSPDENDDALKTMTDVMLTSGIDGMIATNTTCDHHAVRAYPHGHERGGLSGMPLFDRSTDCLRMLKQMVGDQMSLIGVGGISTATNAREKLAAGASLLQVYTGLIYEGPGLVRKLEGIA